MASETSIGKLICLIRTSITSIPNAAILFILIAGALPLVSSATFFAAIAIASSASLLSREGVPSFNALRTSMVKRPRESVIIWFTLIRPISERKRSLNLRRNKVSACIVLPPPVAR